MLEQVAELHTQYSYNNYAAAPVYPNAAFRSLITANPEMHKIFQVIERVAETTSTVLILGESGTGKELIARAIHELSGCKGHFVPVNCGAIPDNLLESELFGYEKGAFTGAVNSKPGRFVLADGGTIFLDEIGEMSPHLQVKLLRVLQERVVEAVGGIKPRQVNVRVIAATNVNLSELVKTGKFREDLFYRLQVVPVEILPLCQRPEDIALLVNHFARKFAKENGRRPLLFSEEVLDAFRRYRWPGNVRELENLVQRLTILVDGDAVYLEDVPSYFFSGDAVRSELSPLAHLPEQGLDFNAVVEAYENSLILQALERTGGNKKAAAKLLNLNRTTLVEKIKKKGLELFAAKDNDPFDSSSFSA
ncbi:MAG TPA: sigma-54 dependent transcriptional regulator [Oligoflexia bacterium]|nr:sigma-54 dependent transcriptional regulator [Oligoflexia bacterium]